MALSPERINFVTASQVAALFGLSPYTSRYQLWQEKITGIAAPFDDAVTFRGKALEGAVLTYFERENHIKTKSGNDAFYADAPNKLGATPDAFCLLGGENFIIIEAKTSDGKTFDSWNDEVPFHYELQVQLQMHCCGHKDYAYLAVLVLRSHGLDYHQYKIGYDPEIIEMILKESKKFWQEVASNTPPEMDFAHDTAAFQKKAWFDKEGVIDLSQNNEAVMILSQVQAIDAHEKAGREHFLNLVQGDENLSEFHKLSYSALLEKPRTLKTAIAAKMGNAATANINGTQFKVSVVNLSARTIPETKYLKFNMK